MAVTLFDVVSKLKPDGAFSMIVPVLMSLGVATFSVMTGPVSALNAPPVVSAEIAEPPVAGVSVTAAKAVSAPPKMKRTVMKAAA